jgi:thiosulfate dehydrogenase [quinone] large subunit
LLRLWLGLRALLAGIEKFSGEVVVQKPLIGADGQPDPSGAMVEIEQKVYGFQYYRAVPDSMQTSFAAQPLLPSFLTTPFYASLGYILILLGLALLAGVKTRWTLIAMGLLYTVLSAGLILIKQDAGVAWLAIHLGLIVLALQFEKYNRFAITRT